LQLFYLDGQAAQMPQYAAIVWVGS
jgi:hypothetical protein